jgi:hypothetical protein
VTDTVMVVLDVLLEVVGSGVVPVDGNEAGRQPRTQILAGVGLLGGTVRLGVAVLNAELLKVLTPGQTGRRRGGRGSAESYSFGTKREEVVHPVGDRVASAHVALRLLVRFLHISLRPHHAKNVGSSR